MRFLPLISRGPQAVEGLEFLNSSSDVIVVSFILTSEALTVVVHLTVFKGPVKLGFNIASIGGNLLKVLHIVELSECANLGRNFDDLLIEILLFLLHGLHKLVFLFLKGLDLFANHGLSIVRRAV